MMPSWLRDKIHIRRKNPFLLKSTIRQYLSTMNSIRNQVGDDIYLSSHDAEKCSLLLYEKYLDGYIRYNTLRSYYNTLCMFSPNTRIEKIYYDSRSAYRPVAD
jgi:hypothetical protein